MAETQRNREARHEMLAAIRQQLAASAPFDAVHEANRAHHQAPLTSSPPSIVTPLTLLEHFRLSLEAVGGHCLAVPDEAAAAEAVRRVIEQYGAKRIAVSDSPLVARVLPYIQSDADLLPRANSSQMFACDLGITGAQWAIAETGTLALESDRERHRLASLVPPVHIAIINEACIRRTLGEVLQAIDTKGKELSRAVTFITGPSRTSDIELTLAIGVHGPAELYIIVMEGAAV